MFGYIKPYVPSLTVSEHEAYKAVYCGLCREMGKKTGQASRFFLSFDMTYLAIFRAAIEKVAFEFERKPCIAHPFTPRTYAKSNSVLTFCASVSAILTDGKIKDDVCDESGIKKAASVLLSPVTGGFVKRCPAGEKSLKDKVDAHLKALSQAEKEKKPSIDYPADFSARMISDVASFGLDEYNERIAREVGFRIGKIIYVLDAADDVFNDIKGEKFNPLALLYGKEPFETGKEKKLPKNIADGLYAAICIECEKLKCALDLADLSPSPTLSGIIYNVADKGIKATARHVLYGVGENENPFRHRY